MLRASASRQSVQRRGRGIRLLVLVGLCVFLLSVVFLFNAWRPSSFAFYVTVTAVIYPPVL
jgi:multisubunit Na+/H+ antiporter MnhB subunit